MPLTSVSQLLLLTELISRVASICWSEASEIGNGRCKELTQTSYSLYPSTTRISKLLYFKIRSKWILLSNIKRPRTLRTQTWIILSLETHFCILGNYEFLILTYVYPVGKVCLRFWNSKRYKLIKIWNHNCQRKGFPFNTQW